MKKEKRCARFFQFLVFLSARLLPSSIHRMTICHRHIFFVHFFVSFFLSVFFFCPLANARVNFFTSRKHEKERKICAPHAETQECHAQAQAQAVAPNGLFFFLSLEATIFCDAFSHFAVARCDASIWYRSLLDLHYEMAGNERMERNIEEQDR